MARSPPGPGVMLQDEVCAIPPECQSEDTGKITVGAEPAEAAKTRPPMSVIRKASMAACGKPG